MPHAHVPAWTYTYFQFGLPLRPGEPPPVVMRLNGDGGTIERTLLFRFQEGVGG